ncbi:hypothetical protein LCGC14_2552290 [marine sediment metagenome]|uniref:Uncharacterized protein n=1 Tax=marine sediment metagenome TaxID=412755 RepID=A0A0F9CYT9_9ZZZZ
MNKDLKVLEPTPIPASVSAIPCSRCGAKVRTIRFEVDRSSRLGPDIKYLCGDCLYILDRYLNNRELIEYKG